MLVGLLVFECCLSVFVILATSMVEHKFKTIEVSLGLYKNKRAYKTQQHIAFIEDILEKYKRCLGTSALEEADLESLIKKRLKEEKIGNFTYPVIRSVATQLRKLMWGVILLEAIIIVVTGQINMLQNIIIIVSSMLLTLCMEFYCVLRALDEKNDALITDIEDYVYNIYPRKVAKLTTGPDLKVISNKVIAFERSKEVAHFEVDKKKGIAQEEQLKVYKMQQEQSMQIVKIKENIEKHIEKKMIDKKDESKQSVNKNTKNKLSAQEIANLIEKFQ